MSFSDAPPHHWLAKGPPAQGEGVGHVLCRGHILQVLQKVIRPVSIYVVDLPMVQARRYAQESSSDQAMYQKKPPPDEDVAIPVAAQRSEADFATCSANSTTRADLPTSRIADVAEPDATHVVPQQEEGGVCHGSCRSCSRFIWTSGCLFCRKGRLKGCKQGLPRTHAHTSCNTPQVNHPEDDTILKIDVVWKRAKVRAALVAAKPRSAWSPLRDRVSSASVATKLSQSFLNHLLGLHKYNPKSLQCIFVCKVWQANEGAADLTEAREWQSCPFARRQQALCRCPSRCPGPA